MWLSTWCVSVEEHTVKNNQMCYFWFFEQLLCGECMQVGSSNLGSCISRAGTQQSCSLWRAAFIAIHLGPIDCFYSTSYNKRLVCKPACINIFLQNSFHEKNHTIFVIWDIKCLNAETIIWHYEYTRTDPFRETIMLMWPRIKMSLTPLILRCLPYIMNLYFTLIAECILITTYYILK